MIRLIGLILMISGGAFMYAGTVKDPSNSIRVLLRNVVAKVNPQKTSRGPVARIQPPPDEFEMSNDNYAGNDGYADDVPTDYYEEDRAQF